MVKMDRKAAILRCNEIQKELAKSDADLDKRESLMKEFEMLHATIDDGSKSKVKEALIKGFITVGCIGAACAFNHNCIIDKFASSFIPKHI